MNIRIPVFEQRVDNIVGIAYATDMLEYVEKVSVIGLSFFFADHMRGNLLDISIEVNIIIVNTWETFICLILKVDQLENSTIGELARKPAYFVIGNFF